MWAVPGGGKEPEDKTIQDTAVRETLEEVGLQITPTNIMIQNNYQQEPEGMFFKLLCNLANPDDFTKDYEFSDEVNDYAWVSADEIDTYEFTPHTKEEIKDALLNYTSY